jgi:hypothetical protein
MSILFFLLGDDLTVDNAASATAASEPAITQAQNLSVASAASATEIAIVVPAVRRFDGGARLRRFIEEQNRLAALNAAVFIAELEAACL